MRVMARKLRVQYPVAMYHVVNMEHLLARHKGDPHKVQIARELRAGLQDGHGGTKTDHLHL